MIIYKLLIELSQDKSLDKKRRSLLPEEEAHAKKLRKHKKNKLKKVIKEKLGLESLQGLKLRQNYFSGENPI